MVIIYTAKNTARILDVAYITIRGWLSRYESGEDVSEKFKPYYPMRLGNVWFFSRIDEPVEPATEEDVLREKAKRKKC